MIISVSGIVGSGKTTVASRGARILRNSGLEVSVLRFQSLPCFRLLPSSLNARAKPPDVNPGKGERKVRRANYRQKRLGIWRTGLYVARALAFRAYSVMLPRTRVHILNRYFYDLFTHYRFEGAVERACGRILQAAIPVPDLALLVVAQPATIAARRPRFSSEYLSAVGEGYRRLPQRFPELVEFSTDPTGDVEDLEVLILTAIRDLGQLTPNSLHSRREPGRGAQP